jgi:hypothetical protein
MRRAHLSMRELTSPEVSAAGMLGNLRFSMFGGDMCAAETVQVCRSNVSFGLLCLEEPSILQAIEQIISIWPYIGNESGTEECEDESGGNGG